MLKTLFFLSPLFAFLPFTAMMAETSTSQTNLPTKTQDLKHHTPSNFKAFTGKINGQDVRMRISPDLESAIVSELSKEDLVVVTGEKGDFYAVEPISGLKAYIFRSFIIDDIVEGSRVNVRLAPDREAPIVGHKSTGDPINGTICENNSKWMEIDVPSHTRFYIAKEFIEYAGNPELKAIHEKRKSTVTQLFDSAMLLSESEMRKPFSEIGLERIKQSYQAIINDYTDFPEFVDKATQALASLHQEYLQRKIAYLELKASKMHSGPSIDEESTHLVQYEGEQTSPTERMKIWEPIEESLYLTWSAMHHAKTMEDFYSYQTRSATRISGVLRPYAESVKNKPGDFILTREKDSIPLAYVYSTHVNLDEYIGKYVTLVAHPRPNNNFAFPAYYILNFAE